MQCSNDNGSDFWDEIERSPPIETMRFGDMSTSSSIFQVVRATEVCSQGASSTSYAPDEA